MGAAKDLWMKEQAKAREQFDKDGDEAAYRKKLEYLLGGIEDSAQQIDDTIDIAKQERG